MLAARAARAFAFSRQAVGHLLDALASSTACNEWNACNVPVLCVNLC